MKRFIISTSVFVCALVLALQSAFAQCTIDIQSKDTASFMAEIPSLDAKIQNCQPKSPFFLYQNCNFQFNISSETSINNFAIILKDGKITGISTASTNPDYVITMTESDFDAFLISDDIMQTYADLKDAGKIQVKAIGFFNMLRLWITNVLSGFFLH